MGARRLGFGLRAVGALALLCALPLPGLAVPFAFEGTVTTTVLAEDPDCVAAGGSDCLVETTLSMRLAGSVLDDALEVTLIETPFEAAGSTFLVRGDAEAVSASWSGPETAQIGGSGVIQVTPAPPGSLDAIFQAPFVSGGDLRFLLEGNYATSWGSEHAMLTHTVTVAPEPATALLVGLGLGLAGLLRRRR